MSQVTVLGQDSHGGANEAETVPVEHARGAHVPGPRNRGFGEIVISGV